MIPRSKYPLRVRHAGTDPVHAAKEHGIKGHGTPCLLWLDPADPHIWCDDNAEITCTKCIERLAPESVSYAPLQIPRAGTLHERLASAFADEIRQDSGVAWRIAETVEAWRREVEVRIRLALHTEASTLGMSGAGLDDVNELARKVMRAVNVGIPASGQEDRRGDADGS